MDVTLRVLFLWFNLVPMGPGGPGPGGGGPGWGPGPGGPGWNPGPGGPGWSPLPSGPGWGPPGGFFGGCANGLCSLVSSCILELTKKRVKEKMAKNQQSNWWWLDNHTTTKRSPWFQSTLSELNEKTKAMLKLIEEDADSFAQRAEMYYKKRPELVSMVEDFYRTHRSLAERYDQVKPDTGINHLMSGGSPFASAKYQIEKLMSFADTGYDTYSENFDVDDSVESEVDDPELDEKEGTKFHSYAKEERVSSIAINEEVMRLREEVKRVNEENNVHKEQLKQKDTICDEVMKLRGEIEKLKEENEAQKEQLKQKDEEKIEVIKQLSFAIDLLKQDNVEMRSFIVKESTKKWKFPFEFNKLGEAFSMKLFNGSPRNQPSVELSRRG
ncbi:protein NETWORKED 3A-like isoform X2 [Cicer arietinum]|uniref:protein NETWORKED 3A-like isoform X2 n=1 Tax=Cicer arietinum TaxID=3827 RepID=UPI003CC58C9E